MLAQPRRKTAQVPPIDVENAPSSQLQELIRTRAYQLYEQRGKIDGHDLEDWLQAEAEIFLSSQVPQS